MDGWRPAGVARKVISICVVISELAHSDLNGGLLWFTRKSEAAFCAGGTRRYELL